MYTTGTKHIISPISPVSESRQNKKARRSIEVRFDQNEVTVDTIMNGKGYSPISAALSKLESLPTELLQEIAWLAHNPLIYLVSKTITSKMFSLKDYEHDLALLLWCDRGPQKREESCYVWSSVDYDPDMRRMAGEDLDAFWDQVGLFAWNIVPDKQFPWKTPVAESYNLKPNYTERLNFQKDVFDLPWLTEKKFHDCGIALMQIWIDSRWRTETFSPKRLEHEKGCYSRVTLLLLSEVNTASGYAATVANTEGPLSFERLDFQQGGKVGMSYHWQPSQPFINKSVTHSLVDNLYIPSYVFETSKCSSDNLLPLMRYCRALDSKQCMRRGKISFSKTDAILSLKKSIQDDNIIAFIRIFCLLLSQLTHDELLSLNLAVLQLISEPEEKPVPRLFLGSNRHGYSIDDKTIQELKSDDKVKRSMAWHMATDLFSLGKRYGVERLCEGML